MPVTLIAAESDEIADLINLVRSASDTDVGLVIPHGSSALQTPLNARLLSQFSRQTGRRTAIVSGDPRVQDLARSNGMRVFSSIPAFERGIETFVTQPAGAPPIGNGAAAESTLDEPFGGGSTSTTLQPPPMSGDYAAMGAASPPSPPASPPARTGAPFPVRPSPRRLASTGRRLSRRVLGIAGGSVGFIGLLLFFLLAPSATVTVTLAGTPLSVNPTIQGSPDPNAAKAGDHILTQVLTANGTGNFTATPTGSKDIPATPAKGTVTVSTNLPSTATHLFVPQGDTFQTADKTITFVVTQDTHLCIGSNGAPAASPCVDPSTFSTYPPNSTVPAQDVTAEAKGNLPANALRVWPQDPCGGTTPSGNCSSGSQKYDFSVTNIAPTTGGADAQKLTTASGSDVSNWNNQVQQIEQTLTTQVNTQLQTQAAGKTFAVDPSGGGKSLTFDVKPPVPGADSQFAATQVAITANAQASVYNSPDVQRALLADVKAQLTQGDQLGQNSFKPGACQVTQAATDGTVILSCTATGFSQPVVNLDSLKKQLSGKNPGDVNKIVQGKVDKVQDVEVSMFPFKLFYLPLMSSRITIDENFVSQPAR
ncbi:MAG: hypothetical protein ACREN2_08600 [Candidatus Dormibacteria bacterium]